MVPVDQTTFVPELAGIDTGNCLQAAVASLLELPLETVPHFAAIPGDDGEWWWALVEFARGHGFAIAQCDEPIGGVLGIMTGKSPRGDFQHVVLARGAEIVHDPHPSRAGVTTGNQWWYLVPEDPIERLGPLG